MEFEKIKGYSKLSSTQQLIFREVFKAHQSSLSKALREGYTPISVSWEITYLKVTFQNGVWLHYTPRGEWY